jgi:hypothetical protein
LISSSKDFDAKTVDVYLEKPKSLHPSLSTRFQACLERREKKIKAEEEGKKLAQPPPPPPPPPPPQEEVHAKP